MKYRKPTVVRVYSVQVSRMGRQWFGVTGARVREGVVVKRWYVVLRFGTLEKRLAVSETTARWLRGKT